MKAPALRQQGGVVDLSQERDLQGAELHGCTLRLPASEQLRLRDCWLSECRADGGDLGRLDRCILRGAQLQRLRLRSLRGCDLRHATLEGVDLQGADLHGTQLYGAQLIDCALEGVQAKGLNIRGLRGLSPEQRTALLRSGAHDTPPWQAPLPPPLRGRPGTLLAMFGALAGLGLLLFLCLPRAPQGPSVTSVADWSPSPDAAEQTQRQLQDFRDGIQAAHLNMKGRGGRTFPTLEEVQANHYDLDGDGPGQALGVLFPKGLPRNLLSPTEGSVLPYCNPIPDQRTLSEEDVDWHYCPETGRVLASAGRTEAPTLEW